MKHPGRRRAAAIGISLVAALGTYAAIAASLSGSPSTSQLAWATLASAITGLLAFITLQSALGEHRPSTPEPVRMEVGLPARRQLPVDIDTFIDRRDEMRELDLLLASGREPTATSPPIAVIRGGGGIGKSALALHLAHLVAPKFPDAQLYLRLGGERLPTVPASAALETLLRGLGLHHSAIPANLEERKAIYRSQLAGQRALLLLDNVIDEEQVEPLLPASPTCAVVVTSRHQLEGIDGVHVVDLEELPEPEAVQLLERLIGADRVAGDRQAASRIVRACGNLPLAVQMAGASLSTTARKRTPLASYATKLEDERKRLDLLKTGNRGIRASFALDYQGLSVGAARMFRLLGLLRVPDLGIEAIAALAGVGVDEAEGLLEELVNAHLVDIIGPSGDRYGLHDLVRVFARECAEAGESEAGRQDAVERVYSWYLSMADDATAYIDPTRATTTARLLRDAGGGGREIDQPLATVPRSDRLRTALDWFERERVAMIALIHQADGTRAYEVVWRLVTRMTHFFDVRNHWTDWVASHQLALSAAQALGNRRAEAEILLGLGLVHRSQGDAEDAVGCLQEAAEISQDVGDRQLEGWARNDLAHVQAKYLRQFEAAAGSLGIALRRFREVGDTRGEASVHDNFGIVYKGQQHLDKATAAVERSLELFGELDEPWGESWVLQNLGDLYQEQGLFEQAITRHQQALTTFKEVVGDQVGEGWALTALGHAHLELGRLDEALFSTQQALDLLRQISAKDGVAQALDTMGQIYRRQQRFDEAIASHQEALSLFGDLDNRFCMAVTLNNLAEVYGEQRRLQEAIEHHRRALDILRQVGDRRYELLVLRALGAEYEGVGDHAQAERCSAEAEALAEQAGTPQASQPA
jgi:tetratricopeptide (TPR) repeat protein